MDLFNRSLSIKLGKVKQYLSSQNYRKKKYQDLIIEIDSIIEELRLNKPKIKIASPDIKLAKKLKIISEQNSNLKAKYKLQIIPADVEIRHIVNSGELVCLIYSRQQEISRRDRQLIREAQLKNIGILILVTDRESKNSQGKVDHWLKQQNYEFKLDILFPIDNFFCFENKIQIDRYQQFVEQLFPKASTALEIRLLNKANHLTNKHIQANKKDLQQKINEQKKLCFPDNNPDALRQKINKLVQKIHKENNHTFRQIKHQINQSKAQIINPFVENSLIWETQQIIQNSEVKLIKVEKQTYLSPVVKTNNLSETLYLYLANFYQSKFNSWLEQEVQEIAKTYADGGLNNLRKKIKNELKLLASLCDREMKLTPANLIKFELHNFVSLAILKENSQTSFEYHYNQSTWFRLFFCVTIGLSIFLITKILFGVGRYFGFAILLFQFINLLLGQDVKTLKLKQQSKELKRNLDSQHKTLIRFLADRVVQDLIAALDNEHQAYQQQIDAIAQIADNKLLEVKNTINQHQKDINSLQQERQKVLSLLNE